MTLMIIRPPEPSEKQGFAKMALASWLSAYEGLLPAGDIAGAPAMIEKAIRDRFSEFRVAVRGGELLGYYSLGDDTYLWHLYVDPKYFRQGVGRALLKAAEEEIAGRGFDSVTLDVAMGNQRAIQFYEALGFVVTGEDEEEAEVLMRKTISPA
jgi:ribosomal protein S18 acetylase RimI-like enzyme